MSDRFHASNISPMDNAVSWVEKVAQFKGAKYLKSAAQSLTLIEYHNVDVWILLMLIFYNFCMRPMRHLYSSHVYQPFLRPFLRFYIAPLMDTEWSVSFVLHELLTMNWYEEISFLLLVIEVRVLRLRLALANIDSGAVEMARRSI